MGRFLTSEDVRRLGGPEITVEEGTLVTEAAAREAETLGVSIRSRTGAYVEPVPDRGPDADLALRALPNLPEPSSGEAGTGVVVTAVGRNRPGVLAEITAAVGASDANIRDISQRMIEGYFHLILTVELDQGAGFAALKERLECLGGADDYVLRVMHERVFRFMHRI